MAIDGPHHIITNQETGSAEPRRLLTEEELSFSVRLALMKTTGLSGTPRRDRGAVVATIAASVVEYFRQCNYRVFGIIAHSGPIGGPKYLRKEGDEERP